MFHAEESYIKEIVETVTSDVSQRRKQISQNKYQEFPESEIIAAKDMGPYFNGLSSIHGSMEPHNLGKITNMRLLQFFPFVIFDPEYRISQMESYLYLRYIFPYRSYLNGGLYSFQHRCRI